jgi:hypothetical protein
MNVEFDLITFHVAGANHGYYAKNLNSLAFGTRLKAVREPDNAYDKNAIRLDSPEGFKVGYIPAVMAAWVKNLIDQGGYELYAEVDNVESFRALVAATLKMQKREQADI